MNGSVSSHTSMRVSAPDRDTSACRLLAVRTAAASFESEFNLRLAALDTLAAQHRALTADLARLRAELVDELGRAVRQLPDARARAAYLRVRRNVFNGRQPRPGIPLTGPAAEFSERYAQLLHQHASLLEDGRRAAATECRTRIARLLEHPLFRLACRHASPDLWAAVLHRSARREHQQALERIDRALGAYATKFFTKANPIHVFAEVSFPAESSLQPSAPHEIVIDLDDLLAVEGLLLRDCEDGRIRLSLAPYMHDDEAVAFWIAAGANLRVVRLRPHRLLAAVLDHFRATATAGSLSSTREACEAAAARAMPGVRPADVREGVARLISMGILREYLVRDFTRFADDLTGIRAEYDAYLALLQDVHLRGLTRAQVAALDDRLDRTRPADGPAVRYFVNSYNLTPTHDHERAAHLLFDDLAALKPFLRLRPNFRTVSDRIRRFVWRSLRQRGRTSAPYLALLTDFIREGRRADAYGGETDPPTMPAVPEWWRALGALTGELTSLEQFPSLAAVSVPDVNERSLCVKGGFDAANGRFYVAAIYAGGGRFAGRYLLGHAPTCVDRPGGEDGVIDAELAVEPAHNLNFVARRYPVRCGFDTRFAGDPARWVDPADIDLALDGDAVSYRHRITGAPIRFHHRGYQLATALPVPYQFLLLTHADTYVNPFDQAETLLPSSRGVVRSPALYYRSICLRREQWILGRAELASIADLREPVDCALWLQDWFLERLARRESEWFYTPLSHRSGIRRPRFLDIGNLLSVQELRRTLQHLSADEGLSLALMNPPPAHLSREHGRPFVTELMIEV